MEVGKLMSNTTPRDNNTSKDDEVMPPGFRFHPTDEELVGFYLRRQVEKKPICIELIKRVDIYKYDPWDLPGVSTVGDDKEWYFFCIRGRKYRNSTRPNRVTGSGFWKATGIDKPIYSTGGGRGATSECIGLKKSLVYYRGSAGKGGTKTDWMMHEFQLPPSNWKKNNNNQSTASSRNIPQEAEAWTLCRIFKRNASYYKQQQIPADWNEAAAAAAAADAIFEQSLTSTDHAAAAAAAASSKTDSFEYSNHKKYTNLVDSIVQQKESKPVVVTIYNHLDDRNDQLLVGQHNSSLHDQLADHPVLTTPPPPPHLSSWNNLNGDDDYAYFFRHENNWDELRSVVGLAMDSSINYYDRLQ